MEMAVISPILLSLRVARSLTDAAIRAVEQGGIPGCVSIVDGGGNVVLVTRMDGAAIGSIAASIAKARAAVNFGASTFDLSDATAHGRPIWSADSSAAEGIPVAGGVPVLNARGVVIGGVGVGGGAPSQDHEAATAAVRSAGRLS